MRLESRLRKLEQTSAAVPGRQVIFPGRSHEEAEQEATQTVNNMLNRCAATQSLLIIDPYLYPRRADAAYAADLVSVLEPVIRKVGLLRIATQAERDAQLESQVHADLRSIVPELKIEAKYTSVFHDRFWIADGARGIVLGTSMNGIGKRYAIVDYLNDEDASAIVQRFEQIS